MTRPNIQVVIQPICFECLFWNENCFGCWCLSTAIVCLPKVHSCVLIFASFQQRPRNSILPLHSPAGEGVGGLHRQQREREPQQSASVLLHTVCHFFHLYRFRHHQDFHYYHFMFVLLLPSERLGKVLVVIPLLLELSAFTFLPKVSLFLSLATSPSSPISLFHWGCKHAAACCRPRLRFSGLEAKVEGREVDTGPVAKTTSPNCFLLSDDISTCTNFHYFQLAQFWWHQRLRTK